jgi:hypothetical protein
MLGNSYVAERPVASHDGLLSMELVVQPVKTSYVSMESEVSYHVHTT